jgi:hypothetical protein
MRHHGKLSIFGTHASCFVVSQNQDCLAQNEKKIPLNSQSNLGKVILLSASYHHTF